jgi:phage terminase large subunit GpA-like protein
MPSKLEKLAEQFTQPKRKISVLEWSEEAVELSERITEQPGPYSTRFYPYVREILECIKDPTVQRVSLCWGSQTSKTTTFYIMLGYTIDQRPRPILWVFPNAHLCKTFSADRWLPFCRESKALLKHLPRYSDGGIDLDHFTLLKQQFARCTMNLVGAGSQANIRSFPVSILVLDEIDVIPEATRRECLDRIKGRTDYKVLQSSTPISELGGIWQEFQDGDRRRFYVPCPNCESRMIFRWADEAGEFNLRWPEEAKQDGKWNLPEVLDGAFYRCESCGESIFDEQKPAMLKQGEWVASSSAAERGSRSYHLNSFYSPTITFGRMAVEYLKAKQTVDGLRVFTNGWLAEPWRREDTFVDPTQFRALERDYERGEIKGKYRILSVDVQRNSFYWIVRGFDLDGTSYLIDNGMVPSLDDFALIVENYQVGYAVIDTGYRTQEIYQFISSGHGTWFGAKGWDKMPTSYRLVKIDPYSPIKGQRSKSPRINLLHVNKGIWQEELQKKRGGIGLNWFVYNNVDSEYVRQMLATSLVERTNRRGVVVREWRVEGRDDHYWDCENYALALSSAFGIGGVIEKSEVKPKRKAPAAPDEDESFWA